MSSLHRHLRTIAGLSWLVLLSACGTESDKTARNVVVGLEAGQACMVSDDCHGDLLCTSTPAGRVCVVAAAFVPSEDWQLACAAGDRVTVTTEDDGLGWVEVVREADGAKGLVPLSYLTTG